MVQHAILVVSGIPCSNIQCLYTWAVEGWVAVWQVDSVNGVVTAGEAKICPLCEAKQKLPKIFDRAGAIAEVTSFRNGVGQTAGYFCRLDCSKGRIESFNGG